MEPYAVYILWMIVTTLIALSVWTNILLKRRGDFIKYNSSFRSSHMWHLFLIMIPILREIFFVITLIGQTGDIIAYFLKKIDGDNDAS